MADNVSQETASEPAELSIDDIAARRAQASQEDAAIETPEDQEQDAFDDEPAEAVEAETDELEEDAASEEDAEPEAKDDVLIKMDDGSTVTVAELKAEAVNLKTENARISQEVANERRELQQVGSRIAQTFYGVREYLESKLPPAPDPSLAYTDWQKFQQMGYFRSSAQSEVDAILQIAESVDGTVDQISEHDFKKYEAEETAKLIAVLPNLKDPVRLKAAMQTINAYAKSIGYDDKTISATKDHRLLRMAHDAAYGAKARESAQKAKVQVKSAVAKGPVAQRSVHPNSMRALTVNNAAKRAQQTGSLEDVLAARLARQK